MKWTALFLLALAGLACAGGRGLAPRVDLGAARSALEEARTAGAPQAAPGPFGEAEAHLGEAESLLAAGDAERAGRADWLARLATAKAQWALDLARLGESEASSGKASSSSAAEIDRLESRLRRTEEEQRRLEDRVALLQRDLELTETEVIRTKARLKGNETKAEASSAVAEARILMRRLEGRRRGASLLRCHELVSRAERLLEEQNFGAALFFAMKAQDTAVKAAGNGATHKGPDPRRSHYVVRVPSGNLRGGPGTDAPVVGRVEMGAVLEALAVRGEWIQVRHDDLNAWIHASLVE